MRNTANNDRFSHIGDLYRRRVGKTKRTEFTVDMSRAPEIFNPRSTTNRDIKRTIANSSPQVTPANTETSLRLLNNEVQLAHAREQRVAEENQRLRGNMGLYLDMIKDLNKRVNDLTSNLDQLTRENADLAQKLLAYETAQKFDPSGYFKALDVNPRVLIQIYQRLGIARASEYLKKQYQLQSHQNHPDKFRVVDPSGSSNPDPILDQVFGEKIKEINLAYAKIDTDIELKKYLDQIINNTK